jgi:hypothetical protein
MERQERGVYAASSLANPQPKISAIASKTLQRTEGRAPGQCEDARLARVVRFDIDLPERIEQIIPSLSRSHKDIFAY